MRRFIAYSMLAVSMLVAVGVAATPTLTQMNPGREFGDGYEVTFNVKSSDPTKELDSNAAEKVADEMRTRLSNLNFEDYSVKVEKGEGTYGDSENGGSYDAECQSVTVSFSCQDQFVNNVCKYLTFSGTKYTISPSNDEEDLYKADPIKYNEVFIEQLNDLVPIVVIPLTEQGKTDIEGLVASAETPEEGTTTSHIMRSIHAVNAEDEHNHEGEGEQKQPDLFLWSNYDDEQGDNVSEANKNPEIAAKIVSTFYKDTMWYTEQDGMDTEKWSEHSCLKIVCGSMNGDSYDFTKLRDANFMANFYVSLFKASAYDYKITCPTANGVQGGGYDYASNAIKVNASIEELLDYSNDVNISASTTLIVTLVAFAVISVLLVVYFKLFSIGMIATTISTVFVSFLAFIKLKAMLGIPALIGFIIVAVGTLLAEIYYVVKTKEEIYKGRSLKKANQEASKKSNLLTLDVAVVSAFTGLMVYVLGGSALKPMGAVIFFGAIIALLMNLIVFKILMALLCNSSDLQTKYSAFNVNKNKVPNLMMEQKETYVAPLENVNFTKKSKLCGIILGALTVVSIFGIVFFGVKNGSPLNVENATRTTTTLVTTFRDVETKPSEENFKTHILDGISYTNIEIKDSQVYDENSEKLKTEHNFIVKIDSSMNNDDLFELKNKVIENIGEFGYGVEKYDIEVRDVKELIYTPDQGLVALATGISILGVAVYLMFRFKPSRGLAVLATTTAATTVSYGIIALTRIGTTAVTSLAMPVVAISTLLVSLYYLVTEKAMFKENHSELTPELKKEITKKALGKAALPSLLLSTIVVYISLNYFGFGLGYTTILFVSMLVGQLIGIASLFLLTGSLANTISNWLSKIHLPKLKFLEKKENVSMQMKQKSSEPEETTFIGIND